MQEPPCNARSGRRQRQFPVYFLGGFCRPSVAAPRRALPLRAALTIDRAQGLAATASLSGPVAGFASGQSGLGYKLAG